MTDPSFAALTHEPEKVLAIGDPVRITGPGGVVLSGRITNVTPLHSPNGPAGFVIMCQPDTGGAG